MSDMLTITREHVSGILTKDAAPAAFCGDGDTVIFETRDCYDDAVVSEDYLDEKGRTVLWRRFNRDDWALDHFGGRPWSEQLPDNQRLTVNGQTYVHWYDCITEHIL